MIRLLVDKIASSTKNVPLRNEIRVTDHIIAEEGSIIAARVIGEKSTYNTLENCSGRMIPIHDGDIIVGVLGARNALHGFSGIIPDKVSAGHILHILNLGGVIGRCTSINPDVGPPFQVEVLGQVLVFPEFESRQGVPANVKMNALVSEVELDQARHVPIIFVAGTCMNAGKTLASCQIIRHLNAAGLKIAACKLTGVSLLRDVLNMQDYGARWSASFVDAGIVTTSADTAASAAETVISHLSQTDAELIVAELGDGILGMYGVGDILAHKGIMHRTGAFILCANDPVGAWGGVEILRNQFNIEVDVITGPATDNDVGTRYIEESLSVASINARLKGKQFAHLVLDILKNRSIL